jgi:hypothetical protein
MSNPSRGLVKAVQSGVCIICDRRHGTHVSVVKYLHVQESGV